MARNWYPLKLQNKEKGRETLLFFLIKKNDLKFFTSVTLIFCLFDFSIPSIGFVVQPLFLRFKAFPLFFISEQYHSQTFVTNIRNLPCTQKSDYLKKEQSYGLTFTQKCYDVRALTEKQTKVCHYKVKRTLLFKHLLNCVCVCVCLKPGRQKQQSRIRETHSCLPQKKKGNWEVLRVDKQLCP